MSDLTKAIVRVGYAGLNGTGVSSGEKSDILSRLTALESLVFPTVISDLTDVDTVSAPPGDGDLLQWDATNSVWVPYTPVPDTVTTGGSVIIDGGGSTITTGIKGDLVIPYAGTITGWTLLADQSGSISIGAWKDTYANYPPVVGDLLLTATITTATKATATGLSHAVSAGDIIRFNVGSVTSIQRVTVSLTITRQV